MARIETDPNYSSPTFSRATAATDAFKKEDVQNLAAAVSTHDHSTGKGLPLAATSIPAGSITSAMIANGTIVAADIAPGTITSNEIADGTIATADLANASVTNAKLASDTARLNLLTNGGFEIWQRGNGPFNTTSAFGPDRWQIGINSGSMSLSRDAVNVDTGSQYSCAFADTYSGTLNRLSQVLSELAPQLAGKSITVSARTRTNAANALRLNVYADTNAGGGAGSVTASSSTDPGTNTWTTLSASITLPTGANYLVVRFEFIATVSGNLDNAMLVVGSQPADYAPLHPADDLARCQRYYRVLKGQVGWCVNTATFRTAISLSPPMATSPTLTPSVALQINDGAGGFTQSAAAVTSQVVAADLAWFDLPNFSGLTANRPAVQQAGSVLLEANP